MKPNVFRLAKNKSTVVTPLGMLPLGNLLGPQGPGKVDRRQHLIHQTFHGFFDTKNLDKTLALLHLNFYNKIVSD